MKILFFHNRVLRKIFGPKREKVIVQWRRLHTEKLYHLYSSPTIIQVIKSGRMRQAGHIAHMGKRRGAYRVQVGKPDGNRPLGTHRHMWEDNTKMGLKELGGGAGPVARFCGCGNEPLGSIEHREFLDQLHTCKHLKKHCSMELVCLSAKTDVG